MINMSPDIQQLISSEGKKRKEKHGVIFGHSNSDVAQRAIPECCDRAGNVTRGRIFF